jgi:hypothetical protein
LTDGRKRGEHVFGHGVLGFAAGLIWQDDEFLTARKLEEFRILYFYISVINEVLRKQGSSFIELFR